MFHVVAAFSLTRYRFQYLTSIATAPKGSGYTLFAASRLFFQYLPAPYTVERLEAAKWGMNNNGFWDAKIKGLNLVVRHPIHNTPCMRWHQSWDAPKTKSSTCDVTIENDSQEIVELVTACCMIAGCVYGSHGNRAISWYRTTWPCCTPEPPSRGITNESCGTFVSIKHSTRPASSNHQFPSAFFFHFIYFYE